MRNTFVDTVVEAGSGRKDILFISGDAGLGVFDSLREESPSSFLNLGVAEQNMASFGAGLALSGCKVYLYNIIPFLLYRCYEQVRNDICYQNLPLVLIGIGSGVTYAPAGMTHYAIEDIGLAATLPNLIVISPCDIHEARAAAEYSMTSVSPVYVRLAKRGKTVVHSVPVRNIAAPHLIRNGDACVMVFHGSIAEEAVKAAHILEKWGIEVGLVSVPLIQPLDGDSLLKLLEGKRLVVTLEEHFDNTGLGAHVARLAAEKLPSWKLVVRGIPPRFIHDVNDSAGMRRKFGLDAEQIASHIQRLLNEHER